MLEEVLKVWPLQSFDANGRTRRIRYRVFVVVGDGDRVVAFGKATRRCEEAAVSGATANALRNRKTLLKGSWELYNVGTIPLRVTGVCGTVKVCIKPAPPGSGIRSHPMMQSPDPQPHPIVVKVLQITGIRDCQVVVTGNPNLNINLITALKRALEKLDCTLYQL